MSRWRRWSVRGRVGLMVGAGLVASLVGCSPDDVVWGSDGARVITVTEELIDAAAQGEGDRFACRGTAPEFGAPAGWRGRSAEEPERFNPDYWPDQAVWEPQWNINLSSDPDSEVGVEFPSDVFYRETESSLCVVAVGWATRVD